MMRVDPRIIGLYSILRFRSGSASLAITVNRFSVASNFDCLSKFSLQIFYWGVFFSPRQCSTRLSLRSAYVMTFAWFFVFNTIRAAHEYCSKTNSMMKFEDSSVVYLFEKDALSKYFNMQIAPARFEHCDVWKIRRCSFDLTNAKFRQTYSPKAYLS